VVLSDFVVHLTGDLNPISPVYCVLHDQLKLNKDTVSYPAKE